MAREGLQASDGGEVEAVDVRGRWYLGELVPACKRKKAAEAMSEFWPVIELPWDGQDHERSWLNVADDIEPMRECVAHLWDDLIAIDKVLAEVAANFNGETPSK